MAAVGVSPPAWTAIKAALTILAIVLAGAYAWYEVGAFGIRYLAFFLIAVLAFAALGYITNVLLRLKFATGLPGYSLPQTMHLTGLKMEFFDRSLNPNVRYARHALALDESREDFDRVPWVNDSDAPNREIEEGPWFTQFWFAGNHSNIGGSYPENESRLSDISLKWMANQAKKAGLIVNPQYLQLFGKSDGPQHNEVPVGISFFGMNFRWREKDRDVVANATVHPSVWDRFNGPEVLIYDEMKKYRPRTLQKHEKYKEAYLENIPNREV